MTIRKYLGIGWILNSLLEMNWNKRILICYGGNIKLLRSCCHKSTKWKVQEKCPKLQKLVLESLVNQSSIMILLIAHFTLKFWLLMAKRFPMRDYIPWLVKDSMSALKRNLNLMNIENLMIGSWFIKFAEVKGLLSLISWGCILLRTNQYRMSILKKWLTESIQYIFIGAANLTFTRNMMYSLSSQLSMKSIESLRWHSNELFIINFINYKLKMLIRKVTHNYREILLRNSTI